uniref:Large ribosomal subunit protein uL24c n=1 Tax=Vertebrata australis TaxID=1967852 RepID=A0A1Z1MIX0_9FLOR|nr:ribosomal protein L24 [Vertebrata australis]ARW65839.1 ribosomal protein L24 [Vertebrata australis]
MTQIKIDSTVEIISGKHKGKKGKILSICKKTKRVRIESINMQTKHVKPKKNDEKGSIQQIEGPIHYSNIKFKKTIK